MNYERLNIIEKDLFNYIFHPERLEQTKYDFITDNQNIYMEEIQFLIKLKNQLKIKVSNKIIEKILSKINKLNYKSIIKLEKVNIPANNTNNLVLAAESPIDPETPVTETYQDADSNFLVKLILHNNQKKIFAFCRNGLFADNIKLVIHPSKNSYRLKAASEQFVLSQDEVVDGFSIIAS